MQILNENLNEVLGDANFDMNSLTSQRTQKRRIQPLLKGLQNKGVFQGGRPFSPCEIVEKYGKLTPIFSARDLKSPKSLTTNICCFAFPVRKCQKFLVFLSVY